MIPTLTINTTSPHYEEYKKIEDKYKTAMYSLTNDPQRNCRRMKGTWQRMKYEEEGFGLNLTELIVKVGIELIDEKTSDSKIYQQLAQRVVWLNQKATPFLLIENRQIDRRDLLWNTGDFLTKHFVEKFYLPPKTSQEHLALIADPKLKA